MSQILSFLQSAGGFIFIFGIVVLVHELGHFLAAKLTGVYTPRFSIGFGPGPRKRWGETQYQIGIIPLGGYVRMASKEDDATAFLEGGSEAAAADGSDASKLPRNWDPDAMIPFGPKPVPEHRWFESKSLSQKLLILVAGVTMNALLTLVVLFGLVVANGRTVAQTRVVGTVLEAPITESLRGSLTGGDTIVAVQGVAVSNWNDIEEQVLNAPGDTLVFRTHRGEARAVAGPPGMRDRIELLRNIPRYAPPVIQGVAPTRPAAEAGMQPGDSIVAIDGIAVQSFTDLTEIVSRSAGRTLTFTVIRGGTTVELPITPAPESVRDPITGERMEVGRIGVERIPEDVVHLKVGVGEAASLSLRQTGQMSVSILRTLQGLVQRTVAFNELGGPIEIARVSGRAAQAGIEPLLYLLALLSINLAILNLLPIPVLDGGQILIVIAEAVKGSPFSPKARQVILGTGVALVLLLMLAVSFNDVRRLFGG